MELTLFLQLSVFAAPASLSDFLEDYYLLLLHQLSLCDDLKSLWKKGLSRIRKRIYKENLRKTICNQPEFHTYMSLGHLHNIHNFKELGIRTKLKFEKQNP